MAKKIIKCGKCGTVGEIGSDTQDAKPGDFALCAHCLDLFILDKQLQPKDPTELQLKKMCERNPRFAIAILEKVEHIKLRRVLNELADVIVKRIETVCPNCKKDLQGLADYGEQIQTMQPGNITICVNCTSALMLTEERKLRVIDDEELNALANKFPQVVFSLRMSQRIAEATKKTNQNFADYVNKQAKKN